MLDIFEKEGTKSSSNHKFKFWEHENHPELLDSAFLYNQKLHYLYQNPVMAGYVTEPWYWKYSSVIDHYCNEKGLIDVVILE